MSGGGTPFALPTSSRILLESYVGSPDDMSAPSWTGFQHDRTEFIQTRAELSAFLAEYGNMESSQVGTLLVADASTRLLITWRQYVIASAGYNPQQFVSGGVK